MNRNEYFRSPLSGQICYHVEHQETQECSLRNWSRNEVKPQTGLSGQVGLPDHSLKQVLNNQMWLSHHNQQGHMGPSKLKCQAQTNTHTMATHIQTHTHTNSEWTVEMLSIHQNNDDIQYNAAHIKTNTITTWFSKMLIDNFNFQMLIQKTKAIK